MPGFYTKLSTLKPLCLDRSLVLFFLLQLARLVVGAENVLSTDTLAGIKQLVGAAVTVGLLDGQSLVRDTAVLHEWKLVLEFDSCNEECYVDLRRCDLRESAFPLRYTDQRQ